MSVVCRCRILGATHPSTYRSTTSVRSLRCRRLRLPASISCNSSARVPAVACRMQAPAVAWYKQVRLGLDLGCCDFSLPGEKLELAVTS